MIGGAYGACKRLYGAEECIRSNAIYPLTFPINTFLRVSTSFSPLFPFNSSTSFQERVEKPGRWFVNDMLSLSLHDLFLVSLQLSLFGALFFLRCSMIRDSRNGG